MPGVFKEWINSGVTEREHAYATISSIGALSQFERPAGIFLVDLRGETRFAGAAGAAGAVGGGGVTLAAGTTRLPGDGLPWAADGAGGGTMSVGTTGLPGAGGGAILAARRTTGMPAAGPSGATEGGASGGVTPAAGNVGPAGAGGGCGITVVAGATGLPVAAGLAGGIDAVGPFRRRAGISAGFSTGGATLPSAAGFGLVASFRDDWLASDPPSRGTPRGSSRIHCTAPLPPSVGMKFFFPRRCKSSITHRFEKPVRSAITCNFIWRLAATVDSALGAGINWINTRYRVASASGMAPRRNSRLISDMRSPPSRILTDPDHRICFGLAWLVGVDSGISEKICSFHMP